MHFGAHRQRKKGALARVGMAGFQPKDLAVGKVPCGSEGLMIPHTPPDRIVERFGRDKDARAATGMDQAAL
ncbi:hypothetical protein GALL_413630 [mine drainage metagenome]|uniref:Uncharacterized protein n=1 Tax=mine drainage metagenome TaxID=410659 RepID=A0A1J5PZP3_9ZZZZ